MTLKERITEDMKAAMRAKEAERLGTIRMLLAAMKQKEVDERIELDDAMVVAIVDKLIKQRKDAAQQYDAGNRQDLADTVSGIDHEFIGLEALALGENLLRLFHAGGGSLRGRHGSLRRHDRGLRRNDGGLGSNSSFRGSRGSLGGNLRSSGLRTRRFRGSFCSLIWH